MSTTIEKNVSYYYIEDDIRNVRIEEIELADELSQYLVSEYKDLLFYDKSAMVRMEAADKIANYGRRKTDIMSLAEAAKLDINPAVRTIARQSLNRMETKFLNYRR